MTDFVKESNRIEGIHREPTEQEVNAHREFLTLTNIRIEDLQNLVAVLQPDAKLRVKAGMDVCVGGYTAPRGGPEIHERLSNLLRSMQRHGAYDTHLAYERLPPVYGRQRKIREGVVVVAIEWQHAAWISSSLLLPDATKRGSGVEEVGGHA